MVALPPEAAAMAAVAHGLLSRRELLRLGVSPHAIDNLVKARSLIVVSRGEYRVAGAPVTSYQELLSAVRRSGGHAADESVLGLHSARGYPLRTPFAVAVDAGRRIRAAGLTVIRVDLEDQDVEVVDGIAAMTVERAFISLLPRSRLPRFRTALHDLRGRRELDVRLLHRRARELGDAPGAAEMCALLDSGALISESPPEHDLGRIWLPGDPQPVPQVWISHRGRSYRLDWVFLDSRVAPEYDGAEAHRGPNRHSDARRTLALAACQIQRIPVTAPLLRDPDLRRQILAVHRQRVAAGVEPLVPEQPPGWWNGP